MFLDIFVWYLDQVIYVVKINFINIKIIGVLKPEDISRGQTFSLCMKHQKEDFKTDLKKIVKAKVKKSENNNNDR